MDGAKEITPPPDEFNPAVVWKRPEKKRSSIMKIMLYLASIGLVIVGVFTPFARRTPETQPSAIAAEAASPVPTESVAAVPTALVSPSPEERPTPVITEKPTNVPTPEPTVVPALSGKIHIVVYSDVFDGGAEPYPSEILADVTVDAESFTQFPLPPLPTQEGYRAVGYVLLKNSGLAYLDALYFDHADPDVIGTKALGDTLTADDLGMVPKNTDGVYEAEIHVVWLEDDSRFRLEFYDETLIGEYNVGFPVSSEGLCYLAAFPVPERKGKTFIGWSDASGHMIDAVTYFDFFPLKAGAQSMEEREWSKPIPCKVYACWSDGSGGAPEPTPVPLLKVSCQGCSVLADGGYANTAAFPAGTRVTVCAWQSGYLGRFTVTSIHTGASERSDTISGSGQMSTVGTFSYAFYYTFTVTDDVTVTFSNLSF